MAWIMQIVPQRYPMQRSVSDIKVPQAEVRASKPRASALLSKDSFKDHLSAVRKQESFNAVVSPLLRSKIYQAARNPMKFGIVQSTLKDYDPSGKIANHVSELDETKAKQLYGMIWERAGCSSLSPELAAQHFTAYVRRPRTANEALQKSGGDVGNYVAAIKSAGNRASHADGHAVKQPLSKAAEVSGSTTEIPKSSRVALLPIVENSAVKETTVNQVGPVQPQVAVGGMHEVGKGSYSENVIKESNSLQHTPPFKPFSASENILNFQAAGTNKAELPIGDNGITIAIQKRDAHAGIHAYERARSGKAPAEGMFVKLRIPF